MAEIKTYDAIVVAEVLQDSPPLFIWHVLVSAFLSLKGKIGGQITITAEVVNYPGIGEDERGEAHL